MFSEKKVPNRLADEQSPYLLQHAYNPVDWYPWGPEAFEKAKREDKPVFLSIGYSTCHWCHVMERESFEDTGIAAYLNEYFVAVKVDKEERPDIDAVYMNVCQMLTGSGGWPMTIFMTADQRPFYAGTYFPRTRKYGQPGLDELLREIGRVWAEDREQLLRAGSSIREALAIGEADELSAGLPGEAVITEAVRRFEGMYDRQYGGFGRAPKFPVPHNLLFLIRYSQAAQDAEAFSMADYTLEQMLKGGIYDHIGDGFARYSTDQKWLAPHFEKMLYDNALMVMALLEAGVAAEKTVYIEMAEKTLGYIRREMISEEGGFYSAQDADSEGEEGKFYTFTRKEILDVLGEEEGRRFCAQYDITEEGNFEGKNIVNRIGREILPTEDFSASRERLRTYREKRYQLHKDDKILTSWNALMIIAFARAGQVTGKAGYYETAAGAGRFIIEKLMNEDGMLKISYRLGQTKGEGILDDYAFLAWAMTELYQTSFDISWLEQAVSLIRKAEELFRAAGGGYYLNSSAAEQLLYRPKEQYDGALPSGNSVMLWCLVKLAALTGETEFREAADRQMRFYRSVFEQQPEAHAFALLALLAEQWRGAEVICLAADERGARELAAELGRCSHWRYHILVKTSENAEHIERLAPYTRAYQSGDGTEAYQFYFCQNQTCMQPFSSIEKLKELIL